MNQEMLRRWVQTASRAPQRIAFPEAQEEKILKAARAALDLGAIRPCLVGPAAEITAAADRFQIDLSNMEFIDNTDEALRTQVAEAYARDHDALPASSIRRKGRDPLFFAFTLQAVGRVDCVFAGLTHTTGDVILAAQLLIGLKQGISTVSSMGLLDIPGFSGSEGSLLAFADSAVCVDPSPEELADIAVSTCETVQALLGWEPRCALLSYSTDGSASDPLVSKVVEAVRIANRKRPDLAIDGEFQLDAAISPAVAAKKVSRPSRVAGRANVIVWPDINAGNIGVKLVQQFAGADAYGPMLQGFAMPVSDCSRSAPVSELTGNIVMLAVRSAQQAGRA